MGFRATWRARDYIGSRRRRDVDPQITSRSILREMFTTKLVSGSEVLLGEAPVVEDNPGRSRTPCVAILRVDDFGDVDAAVENCVTVKCVMFDEAFARREVERLNMLNRDKGSRYYIQATRLIQTS